mgnify:CR=1 FL=1
MVILANNGNIVRDTKDDQIIIKKYLDLKDFKTLIQEGKERGLYPIIHVDQFEEGIDLIIEMDKAHKKYHNYVAQSEERYKKVENLLEIEEDKILAVVYAGGKEELKGFHYHINEKCTGCTICARNCPVGAISGALKEDHIIDQDMCTKCGICFEKCNFDAIDLLEGAYLWQE